MRYNYSGNDSTFKTYFKKVVKGSANNTLNLTGLASNRTYYVRIRSYVTYGTSTYYGAYSNIIKVTVK